MLNGTTFPKTCILPDIAGFTGQYFAFKQSPHWEPVQTDSYAWFDAHDVYRAKRREEFFDTGFGEMAGMAFPDADQDHLRPAMDFLLWLFAFDDMTDTDGLRDDVKGTQEAIEMTMKALRNPESPEEPRFKIVASILSIFRRMCLTSDQATVQRFVDTTDLYTQAILHQNVHRVVRTLPTVEEFIALRRDASAVKMCFAVLEYSLNTALPDEVFYHPVLAELSLCCNDVLTWANDVLSFAIEISRGDTQNLVYIAMCDKNLSLQDALAYVFGLIERRTLEFVELRSSLPSFGEKMDNQVQAYVRGMEYWTQGSIEWSLITPRYFGKDVKNVKQTRIVNIRV